MYNLKLKKLNNKIKRKTKRIVVNLTEKRLI